MARATCHLFECELDGAKAVQANSRHVKIRTFIPVFVLSTKSAIIVVLMESKMHAPSNNGEFELMSAKFLRQLSGRSSCPCVTYTFHHLLDPVRNFYYTCTVDNKLAGMNDKKYNKSSKP
jgi:hypothetical protein